VKRWREKERKRERGGTHGGHFLADPGKDLSCDTATAEGMKPARS
jgi:hypothetical protein